jgi:predicted DCC family thiol-disulfide oxidoreductase YuxK
VQQAGPATVLYDADCGFCRWTLAKLLAWDRRGRLRPVAIGSPEGQRLLADLDEQQREASWHLVEPGGTRISAGAAAVPLLRRLPGGGPAAGVLARFPGGTERAYGWVARHRSSFGRLLSAGARDRADARIGRRQALDGSRG